MGKKLQNTVVVITGASSGIGHATAVRLAKRGACLVLAARREPELEAVARECERLGARTLVVPTDVADEDSVEDLAREAIAAFGRIDVWVNNAAVTAFGAFETMPADVYRHVIETNLFGYIHGTRTALRNLREHGHGVIINVASVVSEVPQPWASAYVISKAGIRALGRCLRQELLLQGEDDIHVVTIMPSTHDTPLFQNAGNYLGRAAVAMPPVNKPELVAKSIERAIHRPRREVPVGRWARRGIVMSRLLPGVTERRMAKAVDEHHLVDRPVARRSGNILHPGTMPGTIRGGWRRSGRKALIASVALGLGALALWVGVNDPKLSRQVAHSAKRASLAARKNLQPVWRQVVDALA